MAHRKPLGTTCRTTADWPGEKPRLRDYLVTPAGTWYRIVGVEESSNPDKVKLMLERIAPKTLIEVRQEDYDRIVSDGRPRVHEFQWYERKRKAAA